MSSLAADRRAAGDALQFEFPFTDATRAANEDSLIERDAEVEVLKRAIRGLEAGRGQVVVVEAPAGLGTSALLEYVSRLGEDAGCPVRRAAPGPRLAELRPLVLVLDDAQWSDLPSLQVLVYLARRIQELPILLAVGTRAGARGETAAQLSELGTVRAATVLRPGPLSPSGAAALISRLAPGTPIGTYHESHAATAGVLWLLVELGRQIAEGGLRDGDGDRATGTGADCTATEVPSVTAYGRTVVRRRLAELTTRQRAFAAALAVLGRGAPPHAIASVAGIALAELSGAREALAAAGLLSPDGRGLGHDLIAAAIAEDLSPGECERLHRESARALMHARAEAEAIACHLLRCGPQGDRAVSGVLVRAACAAAGRSAPRMAAVYLERALEECAPEDDRSRLLAQLATFGFDAGLPDSRLRLVEALAEARDTPARVDVLTRLAAIENVEDPDPRVATVLEQLRSEESDPDAQLAVEAAALDMLLTIPGRQQERARRSRAITLGSSDPLLERVVIAHRAWLGIELGVPGAGASASLARSALEGDLLLREAWRRPAYHLCIQALVMADRFDAARDAITALHEEAAARGSLRLSAAASWYASELALRMGQVTAAEKHARHALDTVPQDDNAFTGGAVAVLVCALAERGEFEQAAQLLRSRHLDGALGSRAWEVGARHARARLRLSEGDFERAYADAREAGARREHQGLINPTWTPWRSTASLALAHLGRRQKAAQLADAELALAERFGAPVPIARALHARAVAETGEDARARLCVRAEALLEGVAALTPRQR